MEAKVAEVLRMKELLDADDTNDYHLFNFIGKVLDLTGEKGVLTDFGFRLLQNNLLDDLKIINEEAIKPEPKHPQKPLLRAVLYLTIAFNICLLFGGFVSIGLADKPIPQELKDYLVKVEERSSKLLPFIDGHLNNLTKRLTQKYAKSFDTIKRSCFTKDLFDSTIRIPTHPKDLPAGFKYEHAMELPSA
jgi:hypothetical protein